MNNSKKNANNNIDLGEVSHSAHERIVQITQDRKNNASTKSNECVQTSTERVNDILEGKGKK